MAWGPFNAGGGGGSSGGTAADISYDNSKSGISAANVQEAIDALSVLTLTIQAVPAQSGSLTYTGSTQSPTWKVYDSSMMTIGGVTSGINAGTYTATFTPIGKYVWTDGTQEAKSVSWTIGRAEVKNPCFHIAYTSLSCGAIAATPIQISQCLPSELRFHSPPSVSNAAIMP